MLLSKWALLLHGGVCCSVGVEWCNWNDDGCGVGGLSDRIVQSARVCGLWLGMSCAGSDARG